jgi:RNA polymerase sigma-70 factor (ECF subfamily)
MNMSVSEVHVAQQELDFQCLQRTQAGDSRSLSELYDRYTPLLYPVALRILRSVADAEDAVQDAWLQVWRRSASYDPRRGTVAAWLLTVVRTRALDRYRSMASRSRAESKVDPEPVTPPEDPTRQVAQVQLSARVREAMATLAPQQRQVLEIAYFEGLSQSEIAQRVNAPLGTVKSWTRQALMRLRELLPQEEWV